MSLYRKKHVIKGLMAGRWVYPSNPGLVLWGMGTRQQMLDKALWPHRMPYSSGMGCPSLNNMTADPGGLNIETMCSDHHGRSEHW